MTLVCLIAIFSPAVLCMVIGILTSKERIK